MKRIFTLAWLGAVLCIGACVYDGSNRCGPNQELISNDRCVCVAGFVPGSAGCVPCGEHERESGGACVCADGYARASDAAACLPIPGELGQACDVKSAPCASPDFPECHVVSGTSGYCTTTGCKTSSDCSGGYKCEQVESPTYCRRPPTGYGQSCASDADCAGNEAGFCELLQSHVCLVSCTPSGHECFDAETCCDLTSFGGGVICVPDGKCPTQGGG